MLLRVEIVPPAEAAPAKIRAEFCFDSYLDGPRVKPCTCLNPLPDGKAPDATGRAFFEGRIHQAILTTIERDHFRDGRRGQSIRHQFDALMLELPERLQRAVAEAKRRGILA